MSGGIRTPGVERVHDPIALPAEDDLDRSLRPKKLDDFVGQERIKEQLAIFIEAARARGEALDHVLLAGPPGPRQDVARPDRGERAGGGLRAHRRPGARAQGRRGQLPDGARVAQRLLRRRDPPPAARRSRRPSIPRWRTASCRSRSARAPARAVVTLDLPEFTLIGATTRTGLLTTPLRDRFGVTHRLELYAPADLARIVLRSAGILEVEIDDAGAEDDRRALARHAARGEPAAQARARLRRGARRRHDRRARRARGARPARGRRGRASTGSTATSCATSARSSAAGRSGSRRCRSRSARSPDTIEDVYEPYLLQQGFLMRTPRGRVATDAAFAHLGLEAPRDGAQRLF